MLTDIADINWIVSLVDEASRWILRYNFTRACTHLSTGNQDIRLCARPTVSLRGDSWRVLRDFARASLDRVSREIFNDAPGRARARARLPRANRGNRGFLSIITDRKGEKERTERTGRRERSRYLCLRSVTKLS